MSAKPVKKSRSKAIVLLALALSVAGFFGWKAASEAENKEKQTGRAPMQLPSASQTERASENPEFATKRVREIIGSPVTKSEQLESQIRLRNELIEMDKDEALSLIMAYLVPINPVLNLYYTTEAD